MPKEGFEIGKSKVPGSGPISFCSSSTEASRCRIRMPEWSRKCRLRTDRHMLTEW
jgi:hypothetical protein